MRGKWSVLSVLCLCCICLAAGSACLGDESEYLALRAAFHDGKYDEVIVSLEELKEQGHTEYRLLRLLARAYGESYVTHIGDVFMGGGRLTDDDFLLVDDLARHCTITYQEAMAAAPDAFERARTGSEWWQYAGGVYNAHISDAIRAAIDRDRESSTRPSEMQKLQREQFHVAFRAALETDSPTVAWVGDRKDEFAASAAYEFAQLAWMEIPDDHFDRMIKDLPDFVEKLLPSPDPPSGPDCYAETIRWYLWAAITCEPPDEVERMMIDAEIAAFADDMRRVFDEELSHPELTQEGDARAAEFLAAYDAIKDNVFCPYFKAKKRPYQAFYVRRGMEESFRQLSENWQREVAWHGRLTQAQTAYQLDRPVFDLGVRYAVWHAATEHAIPNAHARVPFYVIPGSGGALNEAGYWTMTVGGAMPFEDTGLVAAKVRMSQRIAAIRAQRDVEGE